MRLGVMFDRGLPPEQLVPFARALDETSVDDLWVVEDLGWTGGLTSAATALAVTSRLRVGLGIAPAPLRNPALLAMELGNLARMHPGRLAAGIGHGVLDWMRQVGAAPASPLALLEETITAVTALLRGETVTLHGKEVHLDGVSLVHPPAEPPPVLAGVKRPRSLALSGRVAQGTIVPEGVGPDQVPGIIETIGAGREHELVVFTFLRVGSGSAEAVREAVAGQAGFLGVPPEDVAMASGTAEEAAAQVKSLWAAGATSVAVRPIGADPLGQVHALLSAL
ncbi:alkanesulfonate monooxygenase SsuD/methylene tetrahydromethanopterin reductase-like flavin-dependent oxidoreductase (luciferase family) [Nonomuraea thailandensis]|uniref:Alkanesulfonate monooxygenase SsuD/methylene tetrahydromethanopterin reductase-like flavin-dependent oxidoreductase (Luciferase family) n=1 Tax=Nonomuraea thailandensis TaxID=1188745 RepID=A0A9X2GQ30_9ACTN|nr:LLM class flavin-dependent oxidoreductase [Nonomuraea thailandensis]MCP2361850.1 alkanesulfonate monooxygenase SsuD/methylene tetrahydromethanopterin reductase-like flavin-dependent oxidoreductase (luciferase family) [Nonomuraea thailandensis]